MKTKFHQWLLASLLLGLGCVSLAFTPATIGSSMGALVGAANTFTAAQTFSTITVQNSAYLATSSGFVGIGLTNPAVRLHIQEANGTDTMVKLSHPTNGTGVTDGFSMIWGSDDATANLRNYENGSLILATNNTEFARGIASGYLTAANGLSIGKITAPSGVVLDVVGAASISTSLTVTATTTFTAHRAIRYYKNAGDQTVTGANAPTLVTFDTSDFSSHADFNGSTFTAANTGIYHIYGHIGIEDSAGSDFIYAELWKNGAIYSREMDTTVGDGIGGVQFNGLVSLTAGDTVHVRFRYVGASGSRIVLSGTAPQLSFICIQSVH